MQSLHRNLDWSRTRRARVQDADAGPSLPATVFSGSNNALLKVYARSHCDESVSIERSDVERRWSNLRRAKWLPID